MTGPAKAVADMSAVELLIDLADTLQWPRWFDTDEGDRYAEAVRPRLAELADQLAAFSKPPAAPPSAYWATPEMAGVKR